MLPHTLLPTLFAFVAFFLNQRWVRFGIVGVLATLTYFVLALIFESSGMPIFVGNSACYIFGFGISYSGHRYWTFQSKASHGSAVPKFIAMQLFGFGLNTGIIWLGLHVGLSYAVSMIIAIVIVPTIAYFTSKIWVFRDPAAYIPKVPRAPEPHTADGAATATPQEPEVK